MSTANVKSRSNLWLGLLLLSLALNIGLLGFFAGKYSGLRPTHGAGLPPNAVIGRFVRQLEDSRRQELHPLLRAHRQSMHPGAMQLQLAHGALRAALANDPLDTTQLTSALNDVATASGQRSKEFNQSFIELVQALTTAERLQLSGSLERRRGMRHERRVGTKPAHRE